MTCDAYCGAYALHAAPCKNDSIYINFQHWRGFTAIFTPNGKLGAEFRFVCVSAQLSYIRRCARIGYNQSISTLKLAKWNAPAAHSHNKSIRLKRKIK